MSLIGSEILAGASGQAGAAGYQIEQSLRFDGSASLSRSLGTTSSSWTVSFWTKTALNDNHDGYWFNTSQAAVYMDTSSGAASDRRYKFRDATSGSLIVSNAVIRDPSAWYHVVYKCDGSNRRLYVNDSLDAGFTYSGSTTLSGSSVIGGYYTGSGSNLEAYIAEFHLVDGTALDPTDFGEYDDNGVWRPIEYTGSHGTEGFYLKFDPSATNGIGHDHSGNGNNWTPSGFDTTNTTASTYDVMSDTPTTNWCTLNSAFKNINTGNTYTEGNLVATNGTGGYSFIFNSTIPVSSGKWYAECTMSGYSGTPSPTIGVQDAGNKKDVGNELVGAETGDVGYDLRAGKIYKDGNYNFATGYTTATSGDVIGIKLDLDGNTIEFLKNNTSVGSAVAVATGTGLKVFAGGQGDGTSGIGCTFTWNFGQRAFAYTPPSGFLPLNTSNLPAPDIADGSDYFQTVLYTGDGSNPRSVPNVGFQPSWLWIKRRSNANSHHLVDEVRGAGNALASDLANAEFSSQIGSFDSDGFTTDSSAGAATNANGDTYVAWNWLAANGTETLTTGTITSTVSANPTAGFSIVSYTGTGTAGTVAHGLGVAPSMIIEKNRDRDQNWAVYHSALGATKALILDDLYSAQTATYYWNDTAPTSTVFSVGTWNGVNSNTEKHIAYCFAEVEGYSKVGKYRGNSSNDGAFIYTGFKPAFIMVKGDLGQDWFIADAVRDPYNVSLRWLRPNLTNSEINDPAAGGSSYDILSNGFKWYTNTFGVNRDYDYYYIAFASNPFGGSGISPATAR